MEDRPEGAVERRDEGEGRAEKGPFGYEELRNALEEIAAGREEAVRYLGTTILGRAIPMIRLGDPPSGAAPGAREVWYVSGVGAGDAAGSEALLQFARDALAFHEGERDLAPWWERRRVGVIPMLNCDGFVIRREGCGEHLLRERLLSINGGSGDFSRWEANARGVDLRRNFATGFADMGTPDANAPSGYRGTAPESEPETAALCQVLRFSAPPRLLLHLHSGEDAVSCAPGSTPRTRTLARMVARTLSLPLRPARAPSASLADWFAAEFHAPALTVGCASLPYPALREVLFALPGMV